MIGRMLAHYRIEARLGAGGMGVVYKALDTHLNRTVAIKMLPPRAVSDPGRRERFIREARAASALDHPNIVTIHDIAEADGQLFIVMQYVSGKTLRELLAQGPLPLNDALRYAVQIADGLARAHARGIIHRDLKPANVMVSEEGPVKILDFGLAKLTEPLESEETVTAPAGPPETEQGTVLGTVAYMSPEQAQGKRVDARSDIFSFGSLLYEMVTGRAPFRGDSRLAVLSAIVRDEPEPVSQLTPAAPPELEKLIGRALRKDPERRWQAMADLRVALTEIKEESESGAGPASLPVPRQLSRWVWIAGLAALAVAIGGGVWFHRARTTTEPAVPPPRTVLLTSFSGRELEPALSPDGKQVAFVWDGVTGDNFDIYVKLVEAGNPLRLTTDPAPDSSPAWSPDGSRVAFVRQSEAGHAVFVVPALGGPERKVAQSAAIARPDVSLSGPWSPGLAWSPDGRFLAIVDRSSPLGPNSIFLLSLETGERRRLTSPGPVSFTDEFPAFSPDGQTIAFERGFTLAAGDIYLLPLAPGGTATGEPRRLTFDGRGAGGLAWSPDGGSIVFASTRGGSLRLWRISVSGGGPEAVMSGGENAYGPSLSRQGGRLAFAQQVSDTNIWRLRGPGFKGPSSSPTKFISSTRSDDAPQFSPDGKRIVFRSTRSGTAEIWVCDSEGSNPVQVTSFGGPDVGTPRWSPDGRRIAFDCIKEGPRDIYVISAEGGAPRRLTTESSGDVRPSWSKDGRWIYFGSDRSAGWQVWKAPAEGGPAVQVTRQGGREAFESPDGKFVYYTRLGVSGIWRVPVEGGEETLVLNRGEQGHWAVLHQGIVLLNRRATPGPAIEFFSFATQQSARIAALPKEATTSIGPPGLAVSPDGRWILYVQVDRLESDIVLVENFR